MSEVIRHSGRWHSLKTCPEHWQAVFDEAKGFEVRLDDRDFQVGDGLRLREWDQGSGTYTGRHCFRVIRYILPGGQFGIEHGFVVMGLS